MADEEMTIDERRKYLRKLLPLYVAADRSGKGRLLGEMEHVTGMHRKSLVRLLRSQDLERKPSPVPRGREYGLEVERHPEGTRAVTWESLDFVCAERLRPALVPMARHLAGFGELALTPRCEGQLAAIGLSTLRRMLAGLPRPAPRLPRKGPQEANRHSRGVPMGRMPWDTAQPGHFEADLVHHCGLSASGEYAHTLQLVDIATGWSERVAVMGRGQAAMEGGFRRVVGRVPFPIAELHPDNGSEFFSDHLVRYFGEEVTGMRLSRSRPYRKNDDRNVEQKNRTLVRAYLGHARLDTTTQVEILNEIYDLMWVYYNLFQPVMHPTSKEVVDGKLVRTHDRAATPYERLKATEGAGGLALEDRERLDALYRRTHPRELRQRIRGRLSELWHPTAARAA